MVQVDDNYKRKAVEVAKLYGITDADSWDKLPEQWRKFLTDNVPYKELIRPLVWKCRGDGMTYHQLCIKFGLTMQEVRTILQRAYYVAKKQAK